jgi:ectoine hydroxylase-related dioxygenase (phytanoyl-CoA dioxygenase family)
MKAGSATFHNGLTLHGAGSNMTPSPRQAMTCAYMPQGAVFNGQQYVLPKSYFDALALEDELGNNDLNPLVYSAPRL